MDRPGDIALVIRQIEADLIDVLGDSIPKSQIQFDKSQFSIDILSTVLCWAKSRLQLNNLIVDNLGPHVSSLNNQAAKLDKHLERLGICHFDIERYDETGVLSDLASASQLMSMKDCKTYSFMLALSKLQSTVFELDDLVASEECFEVRALKQFSEEIAPILSTLEKFSVEVERTDQENAESLRALNVEKDFYLKAKQEEYREIIQQSNNELKQSEYHPRLSHESLCELKTTLDELQEQIRPYMDRLKAYQELPPDLSLAELAVERAKKELQELHIEWSGRLSGIESVFNI